MPTPTISSLPERRSPLPPRLAALGAVCLMILAHLMPPAEATGPILVQTQGERFLRFLEASFFSAALLTLPAVWFCLLSPGSLRRWLGVRPGVGRGILAVPPVYLLLIFGCEAILAPVQSPPGQDLVALLREFAPLQRAAAALVVCGLVPLTEELLFRGVLGSTKPAGMLLSAALFAAAHGTGGLFLPLFFFGTVQSLLCRRYGSLLPAVLLHALFNGVTLLLL